MSNCGRSDLLLVAIALASALGCSRSKPPEPPPPPATVKWEGPLRSALEEWTELAGTTMPLPNRAARVSAPVEGRVVSVAADLEGKAVAKGAVLVQLDDSVVRHNLEKAEATQRVLGEEEQQAKLALELAQNEVARLAKLKAEEDRRPPGSRAQLVSPVDIQKADIALKVAQSKLKAASGRLTAGTKDLAALRTQLQFHMLAAPIAGRVGRIQVVRGQTLSVGTAVTEIIDLDEQIDVLCFVPPSIVGRFKVGQKAKSGGFDAEAGSPPEAKGEVAFIADQAEPETGNFALKVRFSNKDAHLKSNRILRVRIETAPARECLSLPLAAVQEDEETPSVVIVTDVKTEKGEDGKEQTTGVARRMQVVLGIRDRAHRQVEIVRLVDLETDAAKKWQGNIKDALFVVEGGQGLQTGDAVKLEEGEGKE